MLAAHQNGRKVLLHNPRAGMAVPVLVDLKRSEISVGLPAVADLSEHYVTFGSLPLLKNALRDHERTIERGARFSRYFTKFLRQHGFGSDTTVAQLRSAIVSFYAGNKAEVDFAIGNVGDSNDLFIAGLPTPIARAA